MGSFCVLTTMLTRTTENHVHALWTLFPYTIPVCFNAKVGFTRSACVFHMCKSFKSDLVARLCQLVDGEELCIDYSRA